MAEQTETKTKHTCNRDQPGMPRPFGRKAPAGECARCDELLAGAPARTLNWVDNRAQAANDDAQRTREINGHFAPGGAHNTGKCGAVCTFGDW